MDMVAFVQVGIGQIVSVNMNTIVEKKHTLNPKITLLFINFMQISVLALIVYP